MKDRAERRRMLIVIAAVFLPMAAVGTLCHESGHWLVMRALGNRPVLHYGSCSWGHDSLWEGEAVIIQRRHEYEASGQRVPADVPPMPGRADEIVCETTLGLLGGPLVNMTIGTIGLLSLWALRRRSDAWEAPQWCALVAALFWSRQPFILACAFGEYLVNGYVRAGGDEVRIAIYNGLPGYSLLLASGIVGAAVCIVTLRLFPAGYRLHLLLVGTLSCIAGYALWYGLLGPLLLP